MVDFNKEGPLMNKKNIKKIGILSVLGILIIIAVGFGGHMNTKAAQYESLIKNANKHMDNNQYDKAITLFQQSLSYNIEDNLENSIRLVQCFSEVKIDNVDASNITAKSVEDIVREFMIKDSSLDTICEFDHEEMLDGVKYFVVHVYEVVLDHTATWGWYYVNQSNGQVFDGTYGNLIPMN